MLGRSMTWSSKLHNKKATSCVAMDIASWSNSISRSLRISNRSQQYQEFNSSITRTSTPKWRLIWKKLKKEKRRIFDSSTSSRVPYDPYTYSQNFDQGTTWADPDSLSRSFSARFAVPSRIFQRKVSPLG